MTYQSDATDVRKIYRRQINPQTVLKLLWRGDFDATGANAMAAPAPFQQFSTENTSTGLRVSDAGFQLLALNLLQPEPNEGMTPAAKPQVAAESIVAIRLGAQEKVAAIYSYLDGNIHRFLVFTIGEHYDHTLMDDLLDREYNLYPLLEAMQVWPSFRYVPYTGNERVSDHMPVAARKIFERIADAPNH